MHNTSTPSGGQPENLHAGTPANFNATAEASPYWVAGLPLNSAAAAAEAKRLRQTISLAEEAIRCAADHRSAEHADGETAEETALRWDEAAEIEAAAKACRKAARSALAGIAVFPDVWSDDEIRAKIEAARAAALGLKATIDRCQIANANRQIRVMARQIAAAVAADRQKGGQS